MDDDGLEEFDLFGEGDTFEQFKVALGDNLADVPTAAAPEPPPAAPPPPAQGGGGEAAPAEVAPGPGPRLPPSADAGPAAVDEGACAVVACAGCAACLAATVDPAVVYGVKGRWITAAGFEARVVYTKDRRAELTLMGQHTLPLTGAKLPPAPRFACPGEDENRFAVGDVVRIHRRSELRRVVKVRPGQLFVKGHAEWVDAGDAEVVECKRGDPVFVQNVEGGDWHPGIVSQAAPLRVRTALSAEPTSEFFGLREDARVTLMGCRLLPSSTLHILDWADGDRWVRVRVVRACATCKQPLKFTTRFPKQYRACYWCSVCGEALPLASGAWRCRAKGCGFDACRDCAEKLRVRLPRPGGRGTLAHVACPACREGPFTADGLCQHWLTECRHNLFKEEAVASSEAASSFSAKLRDLVRMKRALASPPPPTRPARGLRKKAPRDETAVDLHGAVKHKSLCFLAFHGAEAEHLDAFWEQRGWLDPAVLDAAAKVRVGGLACGIQLGKDEEDRTSVAVSSRGEPAPPLFWACVNARLETVKWLLCKGADPCASLKQGLTPLRLCVHRKYVAFADTLRVAMLARAPIHVQVSDESGEFVFVAPSNLSTPGANTRSARLRYWVNKPLREPVQGRLEIFSNVGHPTAFSSETKTPAVTTAPLADFIRALSDYDYQVPGASATPPLPSSLRRRVLVSLSNALSARKKNTPTAALEY